MKKKVDKIVSHLVEEILREYAMDDFEVVDYPEDESEENGLENAELLIDGNRGIYIPQLFAKAVLSGEFSLRNKQQLQEELSILKNGPDEEEYWEAWEDVLDTAILVTGGQQYTLYQEGDLWAVPEVE